MTPEDKRSILALRSRPGATNRNVAAAIDAHGSPRAAARATLPPSTLDRACREADRLERTGVKLVAHDDPAYPADLRQAEDHPLLLFCRGDLSTGDQPAVAIVGSRRATPEGRGVAEALAATLSAARFTVVSGLARGIDGAAHAATLAAGGRTLAVLGSGIDVIYPPEHRRLAERIAAGQGAVLSELPPRSAPLPHHFPMRNRILAGLVVLVVVVEAAERSGTLITAHLAVEYNRNVLAVPGSPLSASHRGTNALIRRGEAGLLQSLEDLVDELPPACRHRFEEARRAALCDVPAEQRPVLEALERERAQSLEALAGRTHLAPGELSARLMALELDGRAAKLPGGRWVRLENAAALFAPAPPLQAEPAASMLSSGKPTATLTRQGVL